MHQQDALLKRGMMMKWSV